jgi:AAA domain
MTLVEPTPLASSSAVSAPAVRSLAELLVQQPVTAPSLVEPGLLPAQGILFFGGEPKSGKSILVANLALSLAAGVDRLGFPIPAPRRVLVCQFELPLAQFVARLSTMRRALGTAADHRLLVDTRAAGHLLSTAQGVNHFLSVAQQAQAEVIILDPLYSTHDQDENDTRAMAALCQALLRLRDNTGAALIVIHHVRKTINRGEIGSAFRGSSALHAVGDTYVLVTPVASLQLPTLELRFQFRYAAPQAPRLLQLNPQTLWFAGAGPISPPPAPGRKVETQDVRQVLARCGQVRYTQLRQEIMQQTNCSKRTAQLAIAQAAQQGLIRQHAGQYQLALTGPENWEC